MNANAETHDNAYKGFFDFEIEKMRRFMDYVKAGPHEAERINVEVSRRDFKSLLMNMIADVEQILNKLFLN